MIKGLRGQTKGILAMRPSEQPDSESTASPYFLLEDGERSPTKSGHSSDSQSPPDSPTYSALTIASDESIELNQAKKQNFIWRHGKRALDRLDPYLGVLVISTRMTGYSFQDFHGTWLAYDACTLPADAWVPKWHIAIWSATGLTLGSLAFCWDTIGTIFFQKKGYESKRLIQAASHFSRFSIFSYLTYLATAFFSAHIMPINCVAVLTLTIFNGLLGAFILRKRDPGYKPVKFLNDANCNGKFPGFRAFTYPAVAHNVTWACSAIFDTSLKTYNPDAWYYISSLSVGFCLAIMNNFITTKAPNFVYRADQIIFGLESFFLAFVTATSISNTTGVALADQVSTLTLYTIASFCMLLGLCQANRLNRTTKYDDKLIGLNASPLRTFSIAKTEPPSPESDNIAVKYATP